MDFFSLILYYLFPKHVKYFLISEAAYAYKLKRHVIPLMVGDAYEPDGWLALMIGTQEYLRFYSANDTECNMPLLIAAIEETGEVQRDS